MNDASSYRPYPPLYPRRVPTDLASLRPVVRAVAWPTLLAFRPSRITLLDVLSHWQVVRGLAYLHALSVGAADAELARDLSVPPGRETAKSPELPALLDRLERHASAVPMKVLDPVARDCEVMLRENPFAAYIMGTELAEDSRPADTEEAAMRASALATYWYECPELRGGLTLVCHTNRYARNWLSWSREYPDGGEPPGAPGIATSPAPPLPAPERFPPWAVRLLARLDL